MIAGATQPSPSMIDHTRLRDETLACGRNGARRARVFRADGSAASVAAEQEMEGFMRD